MSHAAIKSRIRTIPDFPKPGIQFRDITSLLKDAEGFRLAVDQLVARYRGERIDKVAGIEARGFILGACVAHRLERGFIPIRKKGKLPGARIGHDYALEYGTDRVEIHSDAVERDEAVLVVDDLLATGGTAEAAVVLLESVGARVVGCGFVIELPDLGGRARLEQRQVEVFSLCEFEGD